MQQMITALKGRLTQARKEHASHDVAFLSAVVSEASMVGKNGGNREVTDAEVTQVLKKFLEGINTSLAYQKDPEAQATLTAEKALILEFMPQQLTSHELWTILADLVGQGKNLGEIMKHLKASYPGRYNGQIATEITKELLVG